MKRNGFIVDFPGATSREARVSVRWKAHTSFYRAMKVAEESLKVREATDDEKLEMLYGLPSTEELRRRAYERW